MAERDRLIYRYGSERVEKCEKAWEFLMEAMQGQSIEERMHATGSVEEFWWCRTAAAAPAVRRRETTTAALRRRSALPAASPTAAATYGD